VTPQEAHAELIAVQSQRISDLEAQLAECCEARKEAEIQAVEMASIIVRMGEQNRIRLRYIPSDIDYQVAQAVIDQYAKEE
jgi:hypothetical protein